ncbi:MAG: hypothetical protein FWD76_00295 [Firmicutes bacterium]|nr:hypothetical protein [Bacillota bacterium]
MDFLIEILKIGMYVCIGALVAVFVCVQIYVSRCPKFRPHCLGVFKRHKILFVCLLSSAVVLMGYTYVVFVALSWSEKIYHLHQVILWSYVILVASCLVYVLLATILSWRKNSKTEQAGEQ